MGTSGELTYWIIVIPVGMKVKGVPVFMRGVLTFWRVCDTMHA